MTREERDRLIEGSMPLVDRLVRRFVRDDYLNLGDDLRSAGYEALCVAAGKFDPARGYAFAAYAATAVRRALCRHLQTGSLMNIPQEIAALRKRIEGDIADFEAQHGRSPGDHELAERLQTTPRKIMNARSAAVVTPCDLDRITTDRSAPSPETLVADRERDQLARQAIARMRGIQGRVLRAHASGDSIAVIARRERISHTEVEALIAEGIATVRSRIGEDPCDD